MLKLSNKSLFTIFSIFFLLASCDQNPHLSDVLNGKFGSSDEVPPEIVSPAENEKISKSKITLQWSARKGILYYEVEVYRLPEKQAISGSPFKVQASGSDPVPTSLSITLDREGKYEWTVKSNLSGIRKSTFYFFKDAIHVYCPGTESTCSESAGVGIADEPLQDITTAIYTAIQYGINTVKVATRGNGQAYNTRISLAEGILLQGGYSPDFTTRDSSVYETILSNSDAPFTVAAVNIAKTTELSGFTIKNSNTTASDAHTITVQYCTSGLTIKDNKIYAASGASSLRNAVLFTYSLSSLLNNTIYGGSGSTNGYAVYAQSSNVNIISNTIYLAQGSSTSHTIHINDSSPTIARNTIEGSVTVNNQNVIYVENSAAGSSSTGPPVIKNNIIEGAGPCSGCRILYATNSTSIISNNLFHWLATSGGLSGSMIYSINSARVRVINNIFMVSALKNGSTYYPVEDADSSSYADSIENNVFLMHGSAVGNKTSFYRVSSGFSGCATDNDGDSNSATCTVDDTEKLGHWPAGADKARGNIFLNTRIDGIPFVNSANFANLTVANNTGSTTTFYLDKTTTSCTDYPVGKYIEWNRDGIFRLITNCAVNTYLEITVSPGISSGSDNVADKLILFYTANNQTSFDYHYVQNSLTDQNWVNLVEGGLDSSGNNCGSPSSGAGLGPGNKSCGNVGSDLEATTRTTGFNHASVQPNNTSVNNVCASGIGGTCSNPRSATEQAKPNGFSIGPYEKDL
ncbi:MAG: hypothetical protein D6767_06485 [Candidatus Hydrogenedentota bacterium]|nr:MAG: hypothetical protein D6767_06485 [Candidatus Hydrogenedentota bacterium]